MATAQRRHVPHRDFRRVGQQYAHFRREFSGDVVLMKVGAFVEFYAPDPAKSQGASMNLKAVRSTRRGARYGFPLRQLSRRVNSFLARGQSVVLVDEARRDMGRLRERAVRWRFVARRHHSAFSSATGSLQKCSHNRVHLPASETEVSDCYQFEPAPRRYEFHGPFLADSLNSLLAALTLNSKTPITSS